MTKTIYLPKTWAELLALPGMRPSSVTKSEMVTGTIIGDYDMEQKDGERACAIAECGRGHRKGYVISLPDGTLSHIGHRCGANHFGKDWLSTQRKQYGAMRSELAKKTAIAELRQQLGQLIELPLPINDAEIAWAQSVLLSFDNLPGRLRDTLLNRAQQNDSHISETRDETAAEINQRVFHSGDTSKQAKIPRRITKDVGRLLGLPGIGAYTRVTRRIDVEVKGALREAREILASTSDTTADLQVAVRRVEQARAALLPSLMHLRMFVDEENLQLLPLLRDARIEGISQVLFAQGPPAILRVISADSTHGG